MLLFNEIAPMDALTSAHLNTSHVIVQPEPKLTFPVAVLFKYISCYCSTPDHEVLTCNKCGFKYISCYCSTKKNIIRLSALRNLNTSHVIVQPEKNFPMFHSYQFKYISCYCSTSLFNRILLCFCI